MNKTNFIDNINNLQEIVGYSFNNRDYLITAFTHQSFANENDGVESYERLEFLGDAILEHVVSKYIYDCINLSSGVLTKLRSYLVSTDNLSKVSENLRLGEYLIKSKSLINISKKNSADIVESLIGAIYLDGGLDECSKFIQKNIIIDKSNVEFALENCEDSKTRVQEYCQKFQKSFQYAVVSTFGKDHEKQFEVELIIDGEKVALAKGLSIRDAEENCAKIYLKKIENI